MKVLLAVSGGIDSMYLANRRSELFPGAEFAVAHCNFHLRGEESDADAAFVKAWAESHRLECHTADFDTAGYAAGYAGGREEAIRPYLETALAARELGLGLNAGHDLSLENLAYFVQTIPWTDEVSIGHALICDALYAGLEKTISDYLGEIRKK